MDQIRQTFKGKKTYLLATWMICGAWYAAMNDMGQDQLNLLIGAVGAIAASLRAGVAGSGAAKALLMAAGVGVVMGGCASLGLMDPATGTTPAQDIVAGVAEVTSPFPGLAQVAPVITGGVLSILIALGKAKEASEPQPE